MLAFLKLGYTFFTSRAGEWTLGIVLLLLAIPGAYLEGHSAGVDAETMREQARETSAMAIYQAEISKKSALINDQNLAYAKSEEAHKANEAATTLRMQKALAAVPKKPTMCDSPQEVVDAQNALTDEANGDLK